MRRRAWTLLVLLATDGACTGVAAEPARKPERVAPGRVFNGPFLNIAAPNSQGWYLIESSSDGMSFARKGESKDETFVAWVVRFAAPETHTPEEFEAFVVRQAQSDMETERFTTSEFTHQYTEARGYPCVQMRNVSEDRRAQTEGGTTGTLMLENEHLYCRHPTQANLGFAITYSHRGRTSYPNLHAEAQAFIAGVQVPGGGAAADRQ